VIQKFRILNFKAFRDQLLPMSPLTLLTGLNGSGKSSVLQALLLLRQSFDQGLLQKNRLALNGGLLRLGTRQDALFEGANFEGAEEDPARIGFELTSYLSGKSVLQRWDFLFASRDDRVSREVSTERAPVEPVSVFGPGFRFLSAERIGPRLTYAMADNDLDSVGIGVQGEWVAQYLAAAKEQPVSVVQCRHPEAVADHLLNQTEAWMAEFSPGLRIEVEADPARDSVSLRYRFETQRGIQRGERREIRRELSNSYRATNVGFGISYTLPVVVAILAAKPGDLILLEAPEAHLHPRGQSKLGQLLSRAASGGVQVIAETHSDHVMNGVRVAVHQGLISPDAAAFLYFQWDPKAEEGTPTVRTVLMDKDGRVEEWPDGFFDEMDRSLETLLTPRHAS
jgi:predicted ATPase